MLKHLHPANPRFNYAFTVAQKPVAELDQFGHNKGIILLLLDFPTTQATAAKKERKFIYVLMPFYALEFSTYRSVINQLNLQRNLKRLLSSCHLFLLSLEKYYSSLRSQQTKRERKKELIVNNKRNPI